MQNDKIKEYWEGEAGIYSEGIKAELKSETAENWKNLILEYAPEKEHLEVLDVGCGPGFFEIMLGKEGHHVTGIDITENMIHEAKENVKAAGLSADLMTMDCHNLNFPDETFDMIICRNITWTLDDPQKAYKEWLYLHLYDEEKKKIYEAHDAAMWEKYGRGIHAHEDAETGKELSSKLFMSDKKRPAWDLETLSRIGVEEFSFDLGISKRIYTEKDEFYNPTPMFLIFAKKPR